MKRNAFFALVGTGVAAVLVPFPKRENPIVKRLEVLDSKFAPPIEFLPCGDESAHVTTIVVPWRKAKTTFGVSADSDFEALADACSLERERKDHKFLTKKWFCD